MGVRVELVCDGDRPTCHRLPARKALNGATVGVVMSQLHHEAKDHGWVRARQQRTKGWYCPRCAALPVRLSVVA